jgi:hypothetical protein
MSRKIEIMVHYHLSGSPWQYPIEDGVVEGVGNITYPRDKAPLIYTQVVSHPHPMPMVTLDILLLPRSQLHTMCNECISGRVQTSIPCWCPNNKQLPYGRDKFGRTTRQTCWQIIISHSCRLTITIWHTTLGWCINELYVFWAYVLELCYLFVLCGAYV